MVNTYTKQSLVEVAVLYIKDQILSGELKSGDKLIENDISTGLDISRAPVREALRELNVQGLVTFSPRKGNQILEMTPTEILEVFEIRTSLERDVLDILVTHGLLTDEDFARLAALTEEMAAGAPADATSHEKLYRLNFLDISFHRYLWNASGSTRRGQFLEGLFFQLLIAMNKDVVSLGSFEEKAVEHTRIVEALRSGDRERLMSAFHDHLREYVFAALTDEERETASNRVRRAPAPAFA